MLSLCSRSCRVQGFAAQAAVEYWLDRDRHADRSVCILAEMAENVVLDYKKHEAEDLRVPPEELAAEHVSVRCPQVPPLLLATRTSAFASIDAHGPTPLALHVQC